MIVSTTVLQPVATILDAVEGMLGGVVVTGTMETPISVCPLGLTGPPMCVGGGLFDTAALIVAICPFVVAVSEGDLAEIELPPFSVRPLASERVVLRLVKGDPTAIVAPTAVFCPLIVVMEGVPAVTECVAVVTCWPLDVMDDAKEVENAVTTSGSVNIVELAVTVDRVVMVAVGTRQPMDPSWSYTMASGFAVPWVIETWLHCREIRSAHSLQANQYIPRFCRLIYSTIG
jgi:hypothetical protein